LTATEPVTLLDRCRAAMGLDATRDAQQRVREALANQPPLPHDDPIADALAVVLDGGDVPDDLGQRLAEQERRHHTWSRQRAAVEQLGRQLVEHRHEQQRDAADRGLDVCREELARVLDAAAPAVKAITGVDSADAAIMAGLADPWQQATLLAVDYADVRHAQTILLGPALTPLDRARSGTVTRQVRELVLTLGTVRDFHERYPLGYKPPTAPVTGTDVVHVTGSDESTPLPWDTGDPLTNLRWIVTNRRAVWLPTVEQVGQALQAAEQARDAAFAAHVDERADRTKVSAR
jgi:hypothetical protein